MQRNDRDRWPEEYDPEGPRSRPGSRRNSGSLSRRSSIKKEREGKKTGSTAPSSNTSTPKKVACKVENLDFVVTGKQILKRNDRANSLPGYRRQSADYITVKTKKSCESPKRVEQQSSKSRETSLEDDMSLDLSQVSDFEDTNSKYGIKQRVPIASSTPKIPPKNFQKTRSCSLQSQMQTQRMLETSRKTQKSQDSSKSRDSTFSYSRDSLYKTSSTASYRHGMSTELDYSSVSPEYSGLSSADISPRPRVTAPEAQLSSCCVSTWQDCSDSETKVEKRDRGEWNNFWANYNNSLAKVPIKNYYDQCPTPYRTENIDLADLDFSESSRRRSPGNVENLNNIIRTEGLHLAPRETQNMIKCAHILGTVLGKAIERRSKEKEKDENDEKITEINLEETIENETKENKHGIVTAQPVVEPEKEIKKKNLTLNLKATNVPLEVKEEKRCETVTTQTDISLPNTKSAPKIFEKILRQLSKTSVDENIDKKVLGDETTSEKYAEKLEIPMQGEVKIEHQDQIPEVKETESSFLK